jgi:hypothetical protein
MGGKFIEMPTCGIFCSTAIRRKKQRIKIQCLISVQIGDTTEEIIFLIIPNLAVDLIIGCDSFTSWEAIIDFGGITYNYVTEREDRDNYLRK